jgi:hypothetical protein
MAFPRALVQARYPNCTSNATRLKSADRREQRSAGEMRAQIVDQRRNLPLGRVYRPV